MRTGGTELWGSHECDKTGQLRKDFNFNVHKNRVDEKENKPKEERVETNAVVHGLIVETWKEDEERYVFVFGGEGECWCTET